MLFMKRILSQWGWGFACAVTVLMSPVKSSADFLYLFDHTWTGTGPAGPAPWISELFQDLGGGAVSLTISNAGLSGTEYLQELYVNLNTSLDPTKLTFTKT